MTDLIARPLRLDGPEPTRVRQKARQRAFRRLATAHRDEFERYLAEEEERAGYQRRPDVTIDPTRLRELRQARGLTQYDLAERIGMSGNGNARVSEWETGARVTMRPVTAARLAAALDVHLDTLLAA